MTDSQSTEFRPLPNAGPTMSRVGRVDLHPRSTQDRPVTPARSRNPEEPAGLAEWLKTPEASRHVGQWVLLTHDYEVIDSALSPSELLDHHRDITNPLIVLVKPQNLRFVG